MHPNIRENKSHKKAKLNNGIAKPSENADRFDSVASMRPSSSVKETQKALPIYAYKDELIQQVRKSKGLIVVGETGSGKTTQLPQYLFKAGLANKGMIAITQPRRVAAISIAKRVSEELGVRLGEEVGYSIRFEDVTSQKTKIKYMTDGKLLRELLSDQALSKYSVIILDEAHERTLTTDILFGMVKSIQQAKRKDLKIIVMSATLNAEKFSKYFNGAHRMNIPGRLHPVSLYYAPEVLEDPIDAALVSIFQVHTDHPRGDILVFLTGQEEIENMQSLIEEHLCDLPDGSDKLLVCPMYASLPTAAQSLAFEPPPPRTRKVILATNIAETSITLPGIRYVIDTGLVKVRGYQSRIGLESLTVRPVSQANANQRMGRAGREAPGVCFRLFTETAFKGLDKEMEPEIKRCNLASVILLLKAAGVQDVVGFDYMDKPPRDAIIGALEILFALGALTDKGELSPVGRQMSQFPLDPVYSKILLESQKYECTYEVIGLISMLSVDPVFFAPRDRREEANEARKKFATFDGDHLMLLNVLKNYQSVKGDPQWCSDHFINQRSMKQILDIQKQLSEFCGLLKLSTKPNLEVDPETLLKCLLSGSFRNTALLQPDGSYKTIVSHQAVHIHPSSCLFGKRIPAIVYSELVSTTRKYVRNVSLLPVSLLQSVPYFSNATNAISNGA